MNPTSRGRSPLAVTIARTILQSLLFLERHCTQIKPGFQESNPSFANQTMCKKRDGWSLRGGSFTTQIKMDSDVTKGVSRSRIR